MDEPSDASLWSRWRERDEHALAMIIARHSRLVRGICTLWCDDPDDAAQEVFCLFVHKAPEPPADGSLAPWLAVTARNVARQHFRAASRRQERETRNPTHPPSSDEARDQDTVAEVRRAVAALPERHRLPLLLHFWEGHSVPEVSRQLGLPERTVRGRIDAAQHRLRRDLAVLTLPAILLALSSLAPASLDAGECQAWASRSAQTPKPHGTTLTTSQLAGIAVLSLVVLAALIWFGSGQVTTQDPSERIAPDDPSWLPLSSHLVRPDASSIAWIGTPRASKRLAICIGSPTPGATPTTTLGLPEAWKSYETVRLAGRSRHGWLLLTEALAPTPADSAREGIRVVQNLSPGPPQPVQFTRFRIAASLWLLDDTGTPHQCGEAHGDHLLPVPEPGGERIACLVFRDGAWHIAIIDAQGHEQRFASAAPLADEPDGWMYDRPTWRTGSIIVPSRHGSQRWRLQSLDPRTGELRELHADPDADLTKVGCSGNGRWLAWLSEGTSGSSLWLQDGSEPPRQLVREVRLTAPSMLMPQHDGSVIILADAPADDHKPPNAEPTVEDPVLIAPAVGSPQLTVIWRVKTDGTMTHIGSLPMAPPR